MAQKDKKQCPLRFDEDIYTQIREKAETDGLNYQQLGDLLFGAYLRNNREIRRMVKRFVEQRSGKKKETLSDVEKYELFDLIENQHSPLSSLERAIKEKENE
jgi:hypothetical protein